MIFRSSLDLRSIYSSFDRSMGPNLGPQELRNSENELLSFIDWVRMKDLEVFDESSSLGVVPFSREIQVFRIHVCGRRN